MSALAKTQSLRQSVTALASYCLRTFRRGPFASARLSAPAATHFALLLTSLALASCGGGSSGAANVVPAARPAVDATPRTRAKSPTPSPVPAPVPVTLTYRLPANTAGASPVALARRTVMTSSTYNGYTSTAAPITFTLNVTPLGGALSSYGGSCTAAATGVSGTCAVTFSALPGPTTLAGTLTEGGQTIASFSQLQIIAPGAANSINFTANPVVASVNLQLAAVSINAGTPQDVALAVQALDANGNIIAGTAPFVDAGGTPLALTLKTANAQSGGRGTVTIKGPPRLTAPGQAPIYAHYDGNWLASSTISVASSRPLTGALGTTTLTTIPTAIAYAGATHEPNFIAAGPDGNLYFTECNASQPPPMPIGKITQSGTITEFTDASAGNCLGDIVVGNDGNLWFNDASFNDGVFRMTPGGSFTNYSTANAGEGIAVGADGNIWAGGCDYGASCANIYKISPSGTVNTYTANLVANGDVEGMGLGPDGNVWFIQNNANAFGKINTAGKVMKYTGVTANINGLSDCIVTGPDGNLWMPENGDDAVARIRPNGTLVGEYALQSGAGVQCVAVGPDGDIWASENIGALAQITMSGTVTEYPTGSNVAGLALGADGNLWYADQGSGAVGKFVF